MMNPNFKKPVRLGKGSYGTVYSNNKVEAVKVTEISNWDNLQSTIREIHALSQLARNENFVTLNRVRFHEKTLNLYMDRADMNLHDVPTKDLSADTIRKWSIQLFEALAFMREKCIFHRDIKPENILVKKGSLWVCDFGLARQLHDQVGFGTSYIVTRWYRSPELLSHQMKPKAPLKYTEKMDVWSVGAILYGLVFEKPLAPGKTIGDALKIIQRRVARLPEAHEKMTKDVAGLLKGVLQIDPTKRFDTARALYELKQSTAEEYIGYQNSLINNTYETKLEYAPMRPEPDAYTPEQWQKRHGLFRSANMKFPTMKTIVAYALALFDEMDDPDLPNRYYMSMLYAVLVFGSYYNDEKHRRLVDAYKDKLRNSSYASICELLCALTDKNFTAVSAWESKAHRDFEQYLSEALRVPKKRKIEDEERVIKRLKV